MIHTRPLYILLLCLSVIFLNCGAASVIPTSRLILVDQFGYRHFLLREPDPCTCAGSGDECILEQDEYLP